MASKVADFKPGDRASKFTPGQKVEYKNQSTGKWLPGEIDTVELPRNIIRIKRLSGPYEGQIGMWTTENVRATAPLNYHGYAVGEQIVWTAPSGNEYAGTVCERPKRNDPNVSSSSRALDEDHIPFKCESAHSMVGRILGAQPSSTRRVEENYKEYHGFKVGEIVTWGQNTGTYEVIERPNKKSEEVARVSLDKERVPVRPVGRATILEYGARPDTLTRVAVDTIINGFIVGEEVEWQGTGETFVVVDRPTELNVQVSSVAVNSKYVPIRKAGNKFTYGALPEDLTRKKKKRERRLKKEPNPNPLSKPSKSYTTKTTKAMERELTDLQDKLNKLQEEDAKKIHYYERQVLADRSEPNRRFIVTRVGEHRLDGVVVDDAGPNALEFYEYELPIDLARKHYEPEEKS